MFEDEGKKEEEKFEFTPEGEVLGYISLDQARVLAIEHARENVDFYGRRYARQELVWEVASQEEQEDHYDIKLSFRPAGHYEGTPGIDQLILEKTGVVRVRQLLDEPTSSSGQRRESYSAILQVIYWGILAIAVAVAFSLILGISVGDIKDSVGSVLDN